MMPNSLNELLESISPERTLDEMLRCADIALNSFRPDRGVVDGWDEFKRLMSRFHSHVEATYLQIDAMPEGWDELSWSHCGLVFQRLFGRNGEQAAFEIARTGNEGGLRMLMRDVALKMAADYADNKISSLVLEWWNSRSPDERFAAMDEYLDRFGHLLPSELTEGSAARIRIEFRRVLEQHPHLLHRLSRVGR